MIKLSKKANSVIDNGQNSQLTLQMRFTQLNKNSIFTIDFGLITVMVDGKKASPKLNLKQKIPRAPK